MDKTISDGIGFAKIELVLNIKCIYAMKRGNE